VCATLEAYNIANVDVRRRPEDDNDIPVPDLDQEYFYRCLCAASDYGEELVLGDDIFRKSVQDCGACKPASYVPPSISHMDGIYEFKAREMAINARNHILANVSRVLVEVLKFIDDVDPKKAKLKKRTVS
jgi:hypothetical protein